MAYTKTTWTETTPRSTTNLNNMETQYDEAVTAGENLRKDSTKEIRLQVSATAPASPVEGQLYYDSVAKTIRFYNGSLWLTFSLATEGEADTSLTVTPVAVATGSGMVFDGDDTIYMVFSASSGELRKYTISTDTWSAVTTIPLTGASAQRGGGPLVYDGTYLYLLQHDTSTGTAFYRYDISGDSWSAALTHITRQTNNPDLVYDGDNYIYAGGYSNDYPDFYRYSISGNSWSAMTDCPANTSQGFSLVYDGDNYIYALRGISTTFWRYSISANTWSAMASTPAAVQRGASLIYVGHEHIYATRGEDTTGFYRYSITNNTWTSVDVSLPGNVYLGGKMVYAGPEDAGFIYMATGSGTTFQRIPIIYAAGIRPQAWFSGMK